jgi:hypothetical protein
MQNTWALVAFALLRPELDVKAVTTVSGLTDKCAQIVKKLMRIMNHMEIPVGSGMQLPLRKVSVKEYEKFIDCSPGGYCGNGNPNADVTVDMLVEDVRTMFMETILI